MAGSMKGIEIYRKQQAEEARVKAERAMIELQFMGKSINFNSISKQSGVSKSFLYEDLQIKEQIERMRERDIKTDMNQRAKYDKTSKSKDIIMVAKNKRIAKLEEENKKLKSEIERLRGKLYDMK